MYWLFRFFVFVGFLVVVALFSALLAPYFVSWERFTKEFEAQASRIVGQQVKVGGESNLRILPLPFISFEDLSIGQNSDGSPLMTVEEFSLRAELFPFLSGEVRIVEMSMDRPHLNLHVAKNGTIAWTAPQKAVVNPEQVNIEKLNINKGSMQIFGLAGGRSLTIEDLQGDFTARSVAGPWRVEAEAEIDGIPSRLSISTGSYRRDEGELRLKLVASRNDQPYQLQLDGPVKLQNDVLKWSGSFSLTPENSALASGFSRGQDPLPVYTKGTFIASPELVEVNEYRMEVGSRDDPYVITGQGQLAFRDAVFFRMTADGRQVDLDRFEVAEQENAPTSLERRLAAVRSILDRIPVPAAKGEIDALLPAIVAGDTFIRDVRAKVRPFGKGWELRSFDATFPGNTLVEANGRVGIGEEFGFAGSMILASRQPSGLAAWLSGGVDAQIRRLKTLGFSSDVTLTLRQAVLDNLELRMDDAILTGRLQRIAPFNGRAALVAELVGNRVNLQDLQALYSLTQDQDSLEVTSHDLDVRIKAALLELLYDEVPIAAEGVDGWVRVKDGDVSIEKLQAVNVYGARIASTGRLEQVLNNPNGNLKLDIDANDAREFLTFISRFSGDFPLLNTWIEDPALTKSTSLKVELDTRSLDHGARGLMLVGGVSGGSSLKSRIGFDGDLTDLTRVSFDGELSLSNPSVDLLMRQLGVETVPSDLIGEVAGPVSVTLNLKGSGETGFDTRVSANGPDTSIAARGQSRIIARDQIEAEMDVTLGSANLAPYLVMGGLNLPGVGMTTKLPASLQFDYKSTEGKASFSSLTGQFAGNPVSGELAYQRAGLQRPRLSGSLRLGNLPIPILAESIFGYSELFGVGDLIDRGAREFQSPMFSGSDAKIAVSADSIRTGLGFEGTGVSAEIVFLDGELDINDLSFDALGGSINAQLSLKNAESLVIGQMRYAVKNGSVSQLFSVAGIPSFASGTISFGGSVETSGRSQDAMLANLSGNGVFSVNDVEIIGIDPAALDEILLQADVDGFEVDAQNVEELVAETVLDNGFEAEFLDAPYSVNRGQVGVRNLVYAGKEADFNSSLEVSLVAETVNASTSLAFKPSIKELIKGADPVVRIGWKGSLEAPIQSIDASQLEGYLSLRAFEAAQRRVETLEAKVIETQRIRREIAFSFAREQYWERKAEEERLLLEAIQREMEAAEAKRLEEAVRKLKDERKRVADEQRRKEKERQRQAELKRQREAERKAANEAAKRAAKQKALEEQQKRDALLQQRILDTIDDFLQSN